MSSPYEPNANYRAALARWRFAAESAELDCEERGRTETSEQLLNTYKSLRDTLRAMTRWDWTNRRWQREYAATEIIVGDALASRGDTPSAVETYKDASATCNIFTRLTPARARWRWTWNGFTGRGLRPRATPGTQTRP
jgi:hypothetical protein